jgi:hypothetical protein
MSRAPWLVIDRVKTAKIDEFAAIQLVRDLDDAIKRRSLVEIRAFAREAELSGMDQEAARAREIATVIEGKATTSARDELLKIKAASQPAPLSQAQLAAQFDRQQLAAAMNRGSAFNVNTFDSFERERAEIANEQLRARLRRHEEQRAAQAARDQQPKGPRR